MRPLALPPNPLPRFYRGGERIAELRGTPVAGDRPEDWIGSVTTAFGAEREGLTRLEDGRTLADAIAADPEAFLGATHVARHGANPRLLVKLLDAGERLPVHFHPTVAFAAEHLDSPHGKTEAWVIVSAEGADPAVHLGLGGEVGLATLRGWVERQDVAAMLATMVRLPVRPDDVIFVPAGLLHAIGAGILLVELQEPSDLSVLLEWEGFEIDGRADGHLGLGFDTALKAADRSRLAPSDVERLTTRHGDDDARPGVERLLPPEADAFFRAERIRPRPSSPVPQEFSILVVLGGDGRLVTDGGELQLRRGHTVLVPFAAGAGSLEGELDVLRCLPPEASV
jgi:mannose-6-phosphate isomerase